MLLLVRCHKKIYLNLFALEIKLKVIGECILFLFFENHDILSEPTFAEANCKLSRVKEKISVKSVLG